MATTAKIAKDIKLEKARKAKNAQTSVPAPQPLLALRTAARIPAQVRHLPPLLPQARAEWRDSGRDQGELVGSEVGEL